MDGDRYGSAIEWPTMALAMLIYGAWLALTWWHQAVPLWLLLPAGAWLVAWHSSLQHEVLHGHPTRSRLLNDAIGYPPLALWLPYERYLQTHLTHHNDDRLTDPLDDPESRYVTPDDWARLGAVRRALLDAQSTLAGRLLIGPGWVIATFLGDELALIRAGNRAVLGCWLRHLPAAGGVLLWVCGVCGMSAWLYVLGFVLPGTSLMLIRSFCEHRAAVPISHRTAVVEDRGPLSLLFLNNNLHAAHHERPRLAWYRLPAYWRQNRARLLAGNGALLYRSYGDLFARFLLRRHDTVVHPLGRAPRSTS